MPNDDGGSDVSDRPACHVTPSEAKAILAKHPKAVPVAFPKPAPKCKHLWRRNGPIREYESGRGVVLKCQKCSRLNIRRVPALAVRRKAPKAMSADRRKRVKDWPTLRAQIKARDHGRCVWCAGWHDQGTADHAYPRVHSLEDKETNLAWIGQPKGAFGGCHKEKTNAGLAGQIRCLRKIAKMYGVKPNVLLVASDVGTVIERNWMIFELKAVQREIDAGRRPSMIKEVGS